MSICNKCSKSVNRTAKGKVQCHVCKSHYHLACVALTDTDAAFLVSTGRIWRCEACVRERRLSRSLSDTETPVKQVDVASSFSMETLKDMLEQLETKIIRKLEDDLGVSLNLCHEKLDENSKILGNQQELIKTQQEIIDALRMENLALRKENVDLRKGLDNCEQYSRINSVEIYGILETSGENVLQTVIDIGKALDMEIREGMIDVCHRLRKQNNRPTPGIIVRFVRRFDKEKFLQRRRVKSQLSTRHMGLSMDNPIYINQSLTQTRRVLFAKSRQVKQEKHYKFLWVDRMGNIKMRKSENEKVMLISFDDDFKKL